MRNKKKSKQELRCDILAFDFFEELNNLDTKEIKIMFDNIIDLTKLEAEGQTEIEIEDIINKSRKNYDKEMLEYYKTQNK